MGTILPAMMMFLKQLCGLGSFFRSGKEAFVMDIQTSRTELIAEMFKAYVTNNELEPTQLQNVVAAMTRAISQPLDATIEPGASPQPHKPPAVPIEASVTPDHIVCLEDGKQFKSLKRHLGIHGFTPDEYRDRWGLPKDYPMTASKYSKRRSRLAKKIGLGRKRSGKRAAK
jgi:predicted transcriptional regulator